MYIFFSYVFHAFMPLTFITFPSLFPLQTILTRVQFNPAFAIACLAP